MPPQKVVESGFLGRLHAAIIATNNPRGTYRSHNAASNLDYFIVHNDLLLGLARARIDDEDVKNAMLEMASVSLCEESAGGGHLPYQLIFRPRVASLKALSIQAPRKLPTERIIGPLRPQPDWREAMEAAMGD